MQVPTKMQLRERIKIYGKEERKSNKMLGNNIQTKTMGWKILGGAELERNGEV